MLNNILNQKQGGGVVDFKINIQILKVLLTKTGEKMSKRENLGELFNILMSGPLKNPLEFYVQINGEMRLSMVEGGHIAAF